MARWHRSLLAGILGSLAALGGMVTAAHGGELTKVTYVFQWAPDGRWAGEYLAKERGYYKEEGLDVTFTNQRGSLAALQQVGAGAAEFACPEGSDIIVTREKGVPVRSVALLSRNTPIAFMSLKETNITKPEDLLGKKVGVQRASAACPRWGRATVGTPKARRMNRPKNARRPHTPPRSARGARPPE